MGSPYSLNEIIEILRYDNGVEGVRPVIRDFYFNKDTGFRSGLVAVTIYLERDDFEEKREQARDLLRKMNPEVRKAVIDVVRREDLSE